jgi:signal transduction histidine kinase
LDNQVRSKKMSLQKPSNGTESANTVSADEIKLRKRWLELDESDEKIIADELDILVGADVDNLIESMYDHFLSFEETRSFFPNAHVLKHAQQAQKEYFIRFTKGSYDVEYVSNRLNVGTTHHRIDLDPKWYIGAYNRVLSWFLPKIVLRFGKTPDVLTKVLSALMKLIFFDMGLAIECYISAKEQALRQHRDAIRELEMERRVTKSIMENAPTGIVTLDRDFICLECNDEFLKIVDQENKANVVGNFLFKVAPGLSKQKLENVLGDFTYWDWAAWPIKDEQHRVSGLVAMFANVTDRVLLHQQREDFVATLTHDLKTPVLAANHAVSYLIEGDFGAVSDEQKLVLQTILQSNTALYSLVQTLLDVYKFDSGLKELLICSTNISTLVGQLLIEVQPLAQERNIAITARIPNVIKNIECDPDEIRRVIQNLVDNSLKFTQVGGHVFVNIEQTERTTILTIRDDGRGIAEENKPKLFQRFWQAGTTGRHYASTGLGLYLCRRITEGHGGTISCESKLGQGSTFIVELPNEQ